MPTRDRVEEDAERDPRQQQRGVAPLVLLLALDPVRGRTEVFDRRAELVLDLSVARDLAGDPGHAPAAHQLVVDIARGGEGAADVLAELLVLDRPLDVRLDVGNAVFCLGHVEGLPFSRLQRGFSTLGALGAKPRRLRRARLPGRPRPGLPERG